MKSMLVVCSLIPLFACGGGASAAADPTITLAAGTGALQATISNVKQGRGFVYCALFNAADGFPGASPIIGGAVKADSTSTSVPCAFAALPAGDYALSIYQDENGDGKLDTNAFGAPTEGYGASNNVLPATSAPTFEASKVHLDDAQTLTLSITLK
jgi:uncharacterized protein (DUF2141 family)